MSVSLGHSDLDKTITFESQRFIFHPGYGDEELIEIGTTIHQDTSTDQTLTLFKWAYDAMIIEIKGEVQFNEVTLHIYF